MSVRVSARCVQCSAGSKEMVRATGNLKTTDTGVILVRGRIRPRLPRWETGGHNRNGMVSRVTARRSANVARRGANPELAPVRSDAMIQSRRQGRPADRPLWVAALRRRAHPAKQWHRSGLNRHIHVHHHGPKLCMCVDKCVRKCV